MTDTRWNPFKNVHLKATRGVSFEEILDSELIAVRKHPKRANQRMFIFKHKGYIWAVPFVEEGGIRFLKTIYPDRKLMKQYRKNLKGGR